jgi:hypothetical protein
MRKAGKSGNKKLWLKRKQGKQSAEWLCEFRVLCGKCFLMMQALNQIKLQLNESTLPRSRSRS